jgi:ubiquinone/menaquinone biosynthesis C-methylase UbiE
MTSTKDRTRWHRYWDKKSRAYDKQMRFFDRHLFGDSRTWGCSQAEGNVLEVAVGTGLNFEAYPPDITLTGIDFSEAMLDIARSRATELGRTVTLQQADAHHLPFDDASFDTVVCTFGLCAIPDHTKAIAEPSVATRWTTHPYRPHRKHLAADAGGAAVLGNFHRPAGRRTLLAPAAEYCARDRIRR